MPLQDPLIWDSYDPGDKPFFNPEYTVMFRRDMIPTSQILESDFQNQCLHGVYHVPDILRRQINWDTQIDSTEIIYLVLLLILIIIPVW